MQNFILFLFSIPIVSIIIIALYQFFDEMFKKKFELERRSQNAIEDALASVQRRRYTDHTPQAALRNPAAAPSATVAEVSVPQVSISQVN